MPSMEVFALLGDQGSCGTESRLKPKRAEKRVARNTRKGSSRNVSFGGRGVRMRPARRSSIPCASTSAPILQQQRSETIAKNSNCAIDTGPAGRAEGTGGFLRTQKHMVHVQVQQCQNIQGNIQTNFVTEIMRSGAGARRLQEHASQDRNRFSNTHKSNTIECTTSASRDSPFLESTNSYTNRQRTDSSTHFCWKTFDVIPPPHSTTTQQGQGTYHLSKVLYDARVDVVEHAVDGEVSAEGVLRWGACSRPTPAEQAWMVNTENLCKQTLSPL